MLREEWETNTLSDTGLGDALPFLICGPCSAESEEQLLATAEGLQQLPQLDYFRAGIWKPRTRPGDFEGAGVPALAWLQKVRTTYGFKVMVEVAHPEHVEAALKHQIDAVWIGARTVVNPFSVQLLAESLQSSNLPVFVKNPVTPDLKLWMGAIERLRKTGSQQLTAIHRGFHYFTNSPYRNAPMWEIAIELKRLMPELPVITDISHISGKRELLAEIAQKALDLETDGLMIETHYNPSIAKTDAAQQITPEALRELVLGLKVRNRPLNPEFDLKLEKLRTEIDKLDGELLHLLARRMEVIDEIGLHKKTNNLSILQLKRWKHILDDRTAIGQHLGLERDFLVSLLELVHKASINRQERIFNKKQEDLTTSSGDAGNR